MSQLKYPNKSHPKYTGDIITEIVDMYQTGLTAQQVADHIGAAQDTILKILRKESVTRTAGETKSLKLPKDEIIHLYVTESWSATKIGKKFGTDAHIILNRLRSWNIDIVKIKQPKRHDLNIDELSKMYKSNPSSYKIAEHFGVSPSVIQNRLHENGIDTPLGRPKWKALPTGELRNLYKSGKTIQSISNIFRCSDAHVYNKLNKLGLIDSRYKLDESDQYTALSMYTNGERVKEIAIHFNASEKHIYTVLHKLGANLINGGFGIPSITFNGIVVRSQLERFVANWLISHDIEFEYEPPLLGTKYKADFGIGNTFVEVCGLSGIANDTLKYDERLQRKVKFYEDNNLNFILLFPKDITNEYLTKTFIDN